MLDHGGRLRRASKRYGIALERWLDLSTGINPRSWAAEPPPIESWRRLPEDEDGLAEAAREYYGAPAALPTAGSQAAILCLPRLRTPCRVGVLTPGYAEHAARWGEAGHEVVPVTPAECPLDGLDVLVLINPNNPTGHRFTRAQLLDWHRRLAARGGWLVIDETFADTDPGDSLACETHREGLVVLKSLGKFFGLAGARVGFVLAAESLRRALAERCDLPRGWCAGRAPDGLASARGVGGGELGTRVVVHASLLSRDDGVTASDEAATAARAQRVGDPGAERAAASLRPGRLTPG